MEAEPSEGITARTKTIIPMPPIQYVDARQNKSPGERDSTSERTEAPVVVNPETLSNQALVNEKGPPHSAHGGRQRFVVITETPEFMVIAGD